MGIPYRERTKIDWDGQFTHNGDSVRVVMRRSLISVGCSDITPLALRRLLAEYDKRFAECEPLHVVQP